jgi:hypothetical protein
MPRYVTLIAATLALCALAACGGRTGAPTPTTLPAPSGPPVELSAPALDGGQLDVARYRGQVVVIHVFTPDEPSLATDVDQLSALHHEAEDEVVVLGIALEPGGYPIVSAWRRGMQVDYLIAVVTEPEELHSANLAPLSILPTTIILDAQGRLMHRLDRALEPGELRRLVVTSKTRS